MLSGHTLARLRELVSRRGRGASRPRWRDTPGEDVLGPLVAGRRRGPRRTRPSTRSWSRACWRATCCTSAARGCSTPTDEDLRLLAGDYMYALGLSRLARLGDLAGRARARGPDHAERPPPRGRAGGRRRPARGPVGAQRAGRGAAALGPATSRRSRPRARAAPSRRSCSTEVSAQGRRRPASSLKRSTP